MLSPGIIKPLPAPPAVILVAILALSQLLSYLYLSSLFPWMRDRASAALLRHSSHWMRSAEHSASACPPPRQSETLLPCDFTHSDCRTQRTRDSRMPWQAGVGVVEEEEEASSFVIELIYDINGLSENCGLSQNTPPLFPPPLFRLLRRNCYVAPAGDTPRDGVVHAAVMPPASSSEGGSSSSSSAFGDAGRCDDGDEDGTIETAAVFCALGGRPFGISCLF